MTLYSCFCRDILILYMYKKTNLKRHHFLTNDVVGLFYSFIYFFRMRLKLGCILLTFYFRISLSLMGLSSFLMCFVLKVTFVAIY